MTATKKLWVASIVAALGLMYGCTKEKDSVAMPNASKPAGAEYGMTLGQQLPNAYSVENMNAAFHALSAQDSDTYTYDSLFPTHLYIKVHIQGDSIPQQFLEDTSIVLFPYPLDYELIGTGEYLPSDTTERDYAYTVVPEGFDFSGVDFEVLDYCVVPEDDNEILEAVEKKSLMMTGHIAFDDTIDYTRNGESAKATGKPSGRICVYNTKTNNCEGVRNIKVVMHTLVRVRTAHTNANGYYNCDTKFHMNVRYVLSFENRRGFKLWRNTATLLPATLGLGVHSPRGYSYDMYTNSYGWYNSTVNNAVDIYINRLCPDNNIPDPPDEMRIFLTNIGGSWTGSTPLFRIRRVTEGYINICNIFSINTGWFSKILPDMIIAKNPKETYKLYRTVFHEMSHASEYSMVGNNFWRNFVITILSNTGYGNANMNNAGYVGIGEGLSYYADKVLRNYCWQNYYNLPLECTNIVDQSNEWFRPDLLDTIARKSNGTWQLANYYNILSPDITTMCDFKKAIVYDITSQFAGMADTALAPVCHNMYTLDK